MTYQYQFIKSIVIERHSWIACRRTTEIQPICTFFVVQHKLGNVMKTQVKRCSNFVVLAQIIGDTSRFLSFDTPFQPVVLVVYVWINRGSVPIYPCGFLSQTSLEGVFAQDTINIFAHEGRQFFAGEAHICKSFEGS